MPISFVPDWFLTSRHLISRDFLVRFPKQNIVHVASPLRFFVIGNVLTRLWTIVIHIVSVYLMSHASPESGRTAVSQSSRLALRWIVLHRAIIQGNMTGVLCIGPWDRLITFTYSGWRPSVSLWGWISLPSGVLTVVNVHQMWTQNFSNFFNPVTRIFKIFVYLELLAEADEGSIIFIRPNMLSLSENTVLSPNSWRNANGQLHIGKVPRPIASQCL